MTTAAEFEAKVQILNAEKEEAYKGRERATEIARQTLHDLEAPWDERINRLSQEIQQTENDARDAAIAERAASWKGVVPTPAQFPRWAKEAEDKPDAGLMFALKEIRAPKVEGYEMRACAEDRDSGNKLYAAFKDGKLYGWMSVDVPGHPGEGTEARGYVGQRRFTVSAKPLAYFTALLRGEKETCWISAGHDGSHTFMPESMVAGYREEREKAGWGVPKFCGQVRTAEVTA